MSNPRAMAARMTNQKPTDHAQVIGGGTPGLGLTGLDIAGALSLGGATHAETMMVMYKWVQDKSAQAPLFYAVYDEVMTLATNRKWKPIPGKEIFRSLSLLAIAEVTDPKCCPTCGGRGEVWKRGQTTPVTCHICNGIGRRDWTDAMRYRALDIDRKAWERTWEPRYPMVMDVVKRFEARGLAALRNGLEGSD